MHKLAISIVLALVVAGRTEAEEGIHIHNGFVTGNEFLEMPRETQSAYATGLVDGMFLSPFFGAPDRGEISQLGQCMVGMTDLQLVAILNKEMTEHPEIWHEGMHTIAYRALSYVCK